ncbi:MAG: transglycosylase SLT domain-containing protein, partial [Myxococcota bacterium]
RRGQRRYGVPVPPAVRRAIENASRETGVPQDLLMVYAFIESSFDPNARNGSYVGLFQMSQEEFVANGGRGRRTDPVQNALAAARDIRDKMQARSFPRNESANEQALYLYVQHQQGEAGARAHYANLDGVAWRNLRRFYPSDRVAQRAVTRNVTEDWLARYGRDMTSGEFIAHWRERLDEVAGEVLDSPVG